VNVSVVVLSYMIRSIGDVGHALAAERIIIFYIFKRCMTVLTIILYHQQLLAE
jgi:hypothetical protein